MKLFFSVIALVLSIIALVFIIKITSAPLSVVSKTMDTNNIILKYEWFHNSSQAYQAVLSQIATHEKLVSAPDTDSKEKSRLNIELAAMRQNCRDSVAQFNANSAKVNVSIFKGSTLPSVLSLSTCGV